MHGVSQGTHACKNRQDVKASCTQFKRPMSSLPALRYCRLVPIPSRTAARRCTASAGGVFLNKRFRKSGLSTIAVEPVAAMPDGAQQDSNTDWQQQVPYQSPEKGFEAKYTASCLCGQVQYAVDCDPVAAKYCHCTSCQRLHGAPFQWAALFHKKSLRFVKGAEKLMFFYSQDMEPVHKLPCKVACSTCHSPIADEGRNMWMSFPTLFKFKHESIPEPFKPSCHIFYQQRVIDVRDGKPKWSKHQDESEQITE